MSYNIDYIETEKGIIVNYSGLVNFDDMKKSYDKRYRYIDAINYMIADYTEVIKFELTNDDIKQMALITNDILENCSSKVYFACIGATKYMIDTADLWRENIHTSKLIFKSFRRRIEGEMWLEKQLGCKLYFSNNGSSDAEGIV